MSRQDIANVRTKVKDLTVIRNREDAVSVDMLVKELEKESYNPVLLYKKQHESNPNYPMPSEESFILAMHMASNLLQSWSLMKGKKLFRH